jgi:lipopolysaccharide transport system permease protein
MKLETSKSATMDFVEGLAAWRLWSRFGWHDILARYRRSWVGPLWLIGTIAIFVAALGFVYSTLFRVPLAEYLPFVAVGAVVWNFISAICSEGVMTFVESEAYIRQVRRSPFVYILRVVWRNIIVFANQFIVAFIVILIFVDTTLFHVFLALVGAVALILQTLWIVPLLGLLGCRFRDLLPIIQSILQICFFITPVIWPARTLANNQWVAMVNPFHHIIDLVRAPLLGTEPALASYAVVAAVTVCGFAAAHVFYGRFRSRIIYWL